MSWYTRILLIMALFLVSEAFAEVSLAEAALPPIEAPQTHETSAGEPDRFYFEFFKMLSLLGLVIVLLLLASWFLRRMMSTRIQQINSSSAIKIIERRSLTAKTGLYVIDILGKKIAIAESHNGITVLADFAQQKPSFDQVLGSPVQKESEVD